MSSASPRQAAVVRQLYRELLARTRRLPVAQRAGALEEAVARVRAGKSEQDEGKRSELLKELVARVSFLRIMTPRRPGDGNAAGTSFVVRDGELVEGRGDSYGTRVASSQVSMAEYRQRHEQLLKRQHFGRTPPRYDPTTF